MPASISSTPPPAASSIGDTIRDNPDSLSDDQIFTLALGSLRSRVGRDGGGARSLAARAQRVPALSARIAALSRGKQVSAIIEDQTGSLWVGTFDGGLDHIDSTGKLIESFRHDAQRPASLASDEVRAILEDHAGHLWVGTEEGLDLLDRASGEFSHYRHDDSDSASLRDSFIMSLYQDSAGLVWIGTRAGGVSRWNPHSWELGGHRPEWLGGKPVTSFADAPNHQGLDRIDGRRPQAIRRRAAARLRTSTTSSGGTMRSAIVG